jgi:S1-C subfamily serine protease
MKKYILLLIIVLSACSTGSGKSTENALKSQFKRIAENTLLLQNAGLPVPYIAGMSTGHGTAFRIIIEATNEVVFISAAHVCNILHEPEAIAIDASRYRLKIVVMSTASDICVLRFNDPDEVGTFVHPGLKVAAMDAPLSDSVLAFGYPGLNGLRATSGMTFFYELFDFLGNGLSIPVRPFAGTIAPGYSGGPVTDLNANVVGIVSLYSRDTGYGLYIPVEFLVKELHELSKADR